MKLAVQLAIGADQKLGRDRRHVAIARARRPHPGRRLCAGRQAQFTDPRFGLATEDATEPAGCSPLPVDAVCHVHRSRLQRHLPATQRLRLSPRAWGPPPPRPRRRHPAGPSLKSIRQSETIVTRC